MAKNAVSKLAKLMADEKVIAILKATKGKEGLTSKEISQRVNIPTNQLYYTVKKNDGPRAVRSDAKEEY